MAIMSAVLIIQETALSFLAGIQFTFILIMVFSRVFGFKKTFFIILLHVILDNLIMGSFNVLTIFPMLVSYSLIALSMQVIKTNNSIILAFLALFYSFMYCFIFIPFGMIFTDVSFMVYLKSDIVFEAILASFNFIVVLWLYNPLLNNLKREYDRYFSYEKRDVL